MKYHQNTRRRAESGRDSAGWPPMGCAVRGAEISPYLTERIMRFGEYSTHELSDVPEAYEVHLDVDFTQLDPDAGPEAEVA
ncbi:hypothetical protein [Streptomyces spiramyceticus]|uniref:hypothetical protein n=1 Tax=Streptomyces spiramyceticus TaxID=299717 RepID=UPI00237AD8AD|nr:hypothetical protein [Streptomyces spiramyceticus]